MILNATTARQNLYSVINEVIDTQEPVYITAKSGNVVLLSEDDYKAMVETLYLTSIPGMRQKILDGINTPLKECVTDPDDE